MCSCAAYAGPKRRVLFRPPERSSAFVGDTGDGHLHYEPCSPRTRAQSQCERYVGFIGTPVVHQFRARFLRLLFLLEFRAHGPGVAAAPDPELVLLVSSSFRAALGGRVRLDLRDCLRDLHDSCLPLFVVRSETAFCTHFYLIFLPS